MNDKYAVIVNSCDAYKTLWRPFFTLLKAGWSNCPYPIYLNTETEKYNCEDGTVVSICHGTKNAWSDRLIDTIKMVDKKYVLLLLDDFFIDGKVDDGRINKCVEWLEENKNISCFSFYPSKWVDIDNRKYEGFELRYTYGEYRFNMQAALWRKKDLLKLLVKGENPWQTENRGNFRARVLMPKKEFYAIGKNERLVFCYEYGGALHRGKWTVDTPRLLERNNIDGIDFEEWGFDEIPTSVWEKMHLDEAPAVAPKKKIRQIVAEFLLAKGITKWKT